MVFVLDIYRSICSICDRLGLYAEIQVNFGIVWKTNINFGTVWKTNTSYSIIIRILSASKPHLLLPSSQRFAPEIQTFIEKQSKNNFFFQMSMMLSSFLFVSFIGGGWWLGGTHQSWFYISFAKHFLLKVFWCETTTWNGSNRIQEHWGIPRLRPKYNMVQ